MVKYFICIIIISLVKVSNNEIKLTIKNFPNNYVSIIPKDTLTTFKYRNLISQARPIDDSLKIKSITNLKKDKHILNLVEYVKDHEGFRSKSYECLGSKLKSKKFYTIGYGHVIKKHERYLINKELTEQEGINLAYKDLNECYQLILEDKKLPLDNMTKNQKMSLTHFIYSLGIGTFKRSSLYKKLCNTKNPNNIDKDLFTRYCKIIKSSGRSVYVKNLYKTREYEYNLYMK